MRIASTQLTYQVKIAIVINSVANSCKPHTLFKAALKTYDLDGDRPVFSGSLSVYDTALYW